MSFKGPSNVIRSTVLSFRITRAFVLRLHCKTKIKVRIKVTERAKTERRDEIEKFACLSQSGGINAEEEVEEGCMVMLLFGN